MGYDRSPQRVVLSVKKSQVRYYHRVLTFRKTRSERTTRRQKKVRIKVDVSQPPLPYVEPKCCVKLAIHHGVAAYYTNYVLRCDTTCYCNELCDFVCGRRSIFNNNGVAESLSGPASPESEDNVRRPKSMSCDSGFDETDDEEGAPWDCEFVNIDVGHQSVWFCRNSPPGPEDLKVVRSSLYQVMSESATETECSGPSNKMCFRWHKDWERSASAVKTKRKKTKESDLFTYSSPRSRRSKKDAFPARKEASILTRSSSLIDIPGGANKLRKGRQTLNMSSSFGSSPKHRSKMADAALKSSSPKTKLDGDADDVISDYDSDREGDASAGFSSLDTTYSSVLEAIRTASKRNAGQARRSASFRLHVE